MRTSRILSGLIFMHLASCGGGFEAPDGAGGAGAVSSQAEGRNPTLPAALRMTALRALQQAPGHDFARADPASEQLSARIGTHGNQARVEVARGGVELVPAGKGAAEPGAFGLRTVHVGRLRSAPDAARVLPSVIETRAEGQEAVLARDGVEERYLAGPLGLEQSYRIEAPPAGPGPLAIEVAFEGLGPRLATDAKNVVRLTDNQGRTRAVYRDLAAIDAEGRELPTHMEVGGGTVTLVIEDEGAAYPVEVDPLIATEQAKLTASDGAAWESFGDTVSVSGDTAVVGAYHADVGANPYQGSAYVFVRSGTTWSEQARLTASDGEMDDQFGWSASISGDTVVIGGARVFGMPTAGSAYVFVRSGTTWSEQAKLTASDGSASDHFGWSVSVSGDTVAVGAFYDEIGANPYQGSAYVFVRSGTTWSEEAKLTASDGAAWDFFGSAVSVSQDTTVVGAEGVDLNRGSAYVFVRSGTTWSEEAKLTASDGVSGAQLGRSVSVSADTVLVGAPEASAGANGAEGSAYFFGRSGTTWFEEAKLAASDGGTGDWFGGSVSLSAGTAVVGALGSDMGVSVSQGAAYVFVRDDTSWTEAAKLTASDGATNDRFGSSVGVSGATAVVGAYQATVGANGGQGSAYVFLLERSIGDSCSAGVECASGFCANGVCCGTACSAGPCEGCSVAAGAPGDGVCAPLTGPACEDGDACTRTDICQAGDCAGHDPIVCSASDQCHDPGTCDPITGECSNPAEPDGTACSDGDACTEIDTCQAGACTGGAPVGCAPASACHEAGSCDPSTGACSDGVSPDGASCDDGDGCTSSDGCSFGACVGSPVVCEPPDECHDLGSCFAWTGRCLYPEKADGSPCAGGSCTAGVCTAVAEPGVPDPAAGAGAPGDDGCGCGAEGTSSGGAAAIWLSCLVLARARRRLRS